MGITALQGDPIRDYVDWLWHSDGTELELTLTGGTGITLKRRIGQPWGIEFDDVVFDGVKTCCNACSFCFMSMLPEGMRDSLYLRDDDYRLSFLQGNFVTLTNTTDDDMQRIIDYRLTPLQVSLHAVTPSVRERIIGKNHARGIQALEQLLAAGIEIRVQIVLIPGVNDGEELDETLEWIKPRVGISSVGLVPYGYTQFATLQAVHTTQEAQKLLNKIAKYQEEERLETGRTRFMASDEFYRLAYGDAKDCMEHLPPAKHYDGYPQFEDGIGMLRSFVDEWRDLIPTCPATSPTPHNASSQIIIATGTAFASILRSLLDETPDGLFNSSLEVCGIANHFFGGNVDVAGLLTGRDLIDQLCGIISPLQNCVRLVICDVMLNSDGLFLDDMSPIPLAEALNVPVDVVSCSAKGLIEYLFSLQ